MGHFSRDSEHFIQVNACLQGHKTVFFLFSKQIIQSWSLFISQSCIKCGLKIFFSAKEIFKTLKAMYSPNLNMQPSFNFKESNLDIFFQILKIIKC